MGSIEDIPLTRKLKLEYQGYVLNDLINLVLLLV